MFGMLIFRHLRFDSLTFTNLAIRIIWAFAYLGVLLFTDMRTLIRMILLTQIDTSNKKYRKTFLTGAILWPYTGPIKLHHYHGPKCFEIINFSRFPF